MYEKKIEYLKKHLEQALADDDYVEVNSCYQELLKYLDPMDIPDLVQKVNSYNNSRPQSSTPGLSNSIEDLKKSIRTAKRKYATNKKLQFCGWCSAIIAIILCVLLIFYMEESDLVDVYVMDLSLLLFIASLIFMVIGVVFGVKRYNVEAVLSK
jgi:hypothetical protein